MLAKAEEGGHVGARAILGGMYSFGHGVGVDVEQGMLLLMRSADEGHADAQCNLGFMCQRASVGGLDRSHAEELYVPSHL